ncbi:MAG: peptidase T [Lachnospiraceae bacterium]|jgi:tripeptide aminopeptidase
MENLEEAVVQRFLKYVQINTESANGTGRVPSTERQFDLARVLEKELKEIGAKDAWLDEKACVVYGVIPSNLDEGQGRTVGYIAHMDTAPDAPGGPVHPWILRNYDGGDIVLNRERGIVMRAADYPGLQDYIGNDLVLTDGTTLLGGDDKAAIAAIMTMADYCASHPEYRHGKICIAFTPDEEVGGLAKNLDLRRFGSPTAYTLDGDHLGYYEDETFNASEAEITIRGLSVHTGTAKGIMKNAVDIGAELMSLLPALEKPRYTEGREGFFHVVSFHGECEKAVLRILVRDHSAEQFAIREAMLRTAVEQINRHWGEDTAEIVITPTYRSMKEAVSRCPFLIENLRTAIRNCGLEPKSIAFRGGTDGSALSQRGLPCPNLSAGYENAHGRFEYVPVQSMAKNVEILLELNTICSRQNDGETETSERS